MKTKQEKTANTNEIATEKVKAPVHQRKKSAKGGNKKQASKKYVRQTLAKLSEEALESIERSSSKSKKDKSEAVTPNFMSDTAVSELENGKKSGKKSESKSAKEPKAEKKAKNGKKVNDTSEKSSGKKSDKKTDKKSAEKSSKKSKTPRKSEMRGYVPTIEKDVSAKVRVISLGGLNEIGKNITVLECGEDIIIIDCGFAFPDEDMLGVDLVLPDFTYLKENSERVRALVVTHGHEDHIGGIPYLLRELESPIPIYGTLLTLGIIKNKLAEHKLPTEATLKVVSAGDTVKIGSNFALEFIHVNHSIADACALCIDTPVGKIFHTGDFKLDLTPIDGEPMDITRIGELGKEGIELLLCESTNAERPGYTPSERKVGKSLEYIFSTNADKRIVIATFSSNVHRVQQIIDTSARHGRKVAITGRSMLNIVGAATELGYMSFPEGVLIDIADIRRYKPEQITIITTGSQGEPMSALYRMAFSDHREVTLGRNDVVILSSSPIPGNEKLVGRIINELCKNGVTVLHDALVNVHVSGHACQEELKLMQALLKPRYFMPIHGEYRHLDANRQLALEMGMAERDIFISDIGKVLELSATGAKFVGTVPSGKSLVNGNSVGEVGNIVLRDRRHLSQDGLIVVVASVDCTMKLLVSGPDVVSRGFVYVREAEELMDDIKELAASSIEDYLDRTRTVDRVALKTKLKDDISKYLYTRTKRRPMVLPIIMNV
ncbi:MAG: ribonuclease J [Eubacteriales bacterium]